MQVPTASSQGRIWVCSGASERNHHWLYLCGHCESFFGGKSKRQPAKTSAIGNYKHYTYLVTEVRHWRFQRSPNVIKTAWRYYERVRGGEWRIPVAVSFMKAKGPRALACREINLGQKYCLFRRWCQIFGRLTASRHTELMTPALNSITRSINARRLLVLPNPMISIIA